MLTALVLLASIDAAPSSTVSLTLSGENDRPPVSAAPRSLSDVARELRAGRKAVGGFSAVESTVPQSRTVFIPMFQPAAEEAEPEPEVVTEAQPVYGVPGYLPTWFGRNQRIGRHHQHIASHAAPRFTSPPRGRPFASPSPLRHAGAGIFRER